MYECPLCLDHLSSQHTFTYKSKPQAQMYLPGLCFPNRSNIQAYFNTTSWPLFPLCLHLQIYTVEIIGWISQDSLKMTQLIICEAHRKLHISLLWLWTQEKKFNTVSFEHMSDILLNIFNIIQDISQLLLSCYPRLGKQVCFADTAAKFTHGLRYE